MHRRLTKQMRDQAERYGDIEKQLRRWYLEDERTLEEIGRMLGKPRSTVLRWMRRLGIPTREQHWALPASSATNKVEVA